MTLEGENLTKGTKVDGAGTVTGEGSESSPYVASVTGIKNSAYQEDLGYWYAIALSKPLDADDEETEYQYWLKIDSTWHNVTGNNKGGSSWNDITAEKMVFGLNDDGTGGNVDLCMSTETSVDGTNAPATGIFYKINVAFEQYVKVYQVTRGEDGSLTKGDLAGGAATAVTGGDGTSDTAPYAASVTGIAKGDKDSGNNYWLAIALPKPDGTDLQYWVKVGSDWTNVTDNVKGDWSEADEMTFGIGHDGEDGDIELCISTDTGSLSNGTYYKVSVTFAN